MDTLGIVGIVISAVSLFVGIAAWMFPDFRHWILPKIGLNPNIFDPKAMLPQLPHREQRPDNGPHVEEVAVCDGPKDHVRRSIQPKCVGIEDNSGQSDGLSSLSAPVRITCPGCGDNLDSFTKACPKCGTSIRWKCNACGEKASPEIEYCNSCGAPFSEAAIYETQSQELRSFIDDIKADLAHYERGHTQGKDNAAAAMESSPRKLPNEEFHSLHREFDVVQRELWAAIKRHMKRNGVDERAEASIDLVTDREMDLIRSHMFRHLQLDGPEFAIKRMKAMRRNVKPLLGEEQYDIHVKSLQRWIDDEVERLRAVHNIRSQPFFTFGWFGKVFRIKKDNGFTQQCVVGNPEAKISEKK
ncbi:MAG: zinc ribbon domain-containing protein [Thermoguttaceae bacterium]